MKSAAHGSRPQGEWPTACNWLFMIFDDLIDTCVLGLAKRRMLIALSLSLSGNCQGPSRQFRAAPLAAAIFITSCHWGPILRLACINGPPWAGVPSRVKREPILGHHLSVCRHTVCSSERRVSLWCALNDRLLPTASRIDASKFSLHLRDILTVWQNRNFCIHI